MYRPGKKNGRADALSRKEDDVQAQDEVKRQARAQIMIPADKIDDSVRRELQLAPVDTIDDPTALIDRIL